MTTSITKRFTFESAHSLRDHDGKCKNLHGHSYVLYVTVTGPLQSAGPTNGMVMDFADMSKIVNREIVERFDHQFLNDLLPCVTTAENIASYIYTTLTAAGLPVTRIKLHETAKCYVEVSG